MSNTTRVDFNVSQGITKITDSPSIRDLANMDPELLPLFTPIERAVIEVCRDLMDVAT